MLLLINAILTTEDRPGIQKALQFWLCSCSATGRLESEFLALLLSLRWFISTRNLQ